MRARLALGACVLLCALVPASSRAAGGREPTLDSLRALVTSPHIEDHHRAEQYLTAHVRRLPRDVPAYLLLGDLYVLQHRPGEAGRVYRKALRAAPDNRHAHRELGLIRLREWAQFFARRDRERAIDDLARGVPPPESLTTDADWTGLASLAALYCDAHVPRRALASLEPALRAQAAPSAWALLAHAMALEADGRLDSASAEYARGIRALGPLDRDGYIDVRPVCSRTERDEFGALPLEDRATWLAVFWKRHDPTPTTVVNEFQLEFYRRVTSAFLFFRLPDTRWWDARGDVYVRFGAPDVVDTAEGTLIHIEQEYDSPDVIIPDQILWRYQQYRMDVRLAETVNSQIYTFPFPTNVVATNPYLKVWVGAYARSRELRNGGDAAWDPEADFVRHRAVEGEQRAERILDSGGFLVRLDMRRAVVPFASASASFEGDGGFVRQAVTIGVLADALDRAARDAAARRAVVDTLVGDASVITPADEGAPRPASRLTATAVLLDAAFREVARAETRGPFPTIATVDGPMLVARLDLSVAPGHYYLTTSVEDSVAIGAHRTGVRAPDFPNSLVLSDVEVQVPLPGSAPDVRITQPAGVVGLGQPLTLSFEAYNLSRDIRGRAHATIRCAIDMGEDRGRTSQRRAGGVIGRAPGRGSIAIEFPEEVRSSTLERSIDMNIDKLEPGEYTATITVTDTGSGQIGTGQVTFVKSAGFPRAR